MASGTDTARLGYLSPSTRAAVCRCARARSLRATYLPTCGASCVAETVGTRLDRPRCNAPRLSLPLCLVCACASLRLCASLPEVLINIFDFMWGIDVGMGPGRCSMWEHLQHAYVLPIHLRTWVFPLLATAKRTPIERYSPVLESNVRFPAWTCPIYPICILICLIYLIHMALYI